MHVANRVYSLDVIRGLAALAVMLYHYLNKFPRLYIPDGEAIVSFPEGKYGVHIFFLLSGFVISMSAERVDDWRHFIAHRFIRLFPTFWLSVILTYSVVSMFGLPGREVGILYMLLNLPMVSLSFGIPSVDGVYWSLTYELMFYLWIGIILKFRRLGVLDVIIFIYLLLAVFISGSDLSHTFLGKTISHILIFDYGPLFASGILLYFLYNKRNVLKNLLSLVLAFSLSLLNEPTAYGMGVVFFIYVLFIVMVFIGSASTYWVGFLFMGEISYALYLVHQNIGYVIMRHLHGIGVGYWDSVFVAITVSVLLAASITYFYEKRIVSYLKKRWKILSNRFTKHGHIITSRNPSISESSNAE